jgi:hypothetical protein
MERQRIHMIGVPLQYQLLRLTTPTVIQNGNSHFTRILFDDSPLYFQTPRCETKQGIVITAGSKKTYYDLILDSNSETSHSPKEFTAFVEWIQLLEDAVVKLLCSNGKLWFRDPLSEDDIRALFTSPLKPLKGGSQLSLRVNVPSSVSRVIQYTCTVFDENEKLVHLNYITPEHSIISIIEVLGVRFTSNSFHLDLASKQIAVVENQPMFQTCVIQKEVVIRDDNDNLKPHLIVGNKTNKTPLTLFTPTVSANELKPLSEAEILSNTIEKETINIHDPIKVYYALYKAALKRAKDAKRQSIQAFLDAKHIKNKYNLDIYEHDVSDDSDESHSDDNDSNSEMSIGEKPENPTVHGDADADSDKDDSDTVSSEGSGGSSASYTSETLEKPPIQIMDESQSFLIEELF